MIFSFPCFRKASYVLGLSHLGQRCLYFEDKKLKIIRDNIFLWFYFAKFWDLEWILRGGEWEKGWWKKENGYFLHNRMDMDIDSPTDSKNSVPTLWESFENDHLILRKGGAGGASRKLAQQTVIRTPRLGRAIYFQRIIQWASFLWRCLTKFGETSLGFQQ